MTKKDLPEIPPAEPVLWDDIPEHRDKVIKYQKEQLEKFHKERYKDTIPRPGRYNLKTKKVEPSTEKPYKKGFRVYIYPPTRNQLGIITSDPTRKAIQDLDVTTKGTVIDLYNRRDWDSISNHEIRARMKACKENLYKAANETIKRIGHIPYVSLAEHERLTKKYKDVINPVPDMRRYDMEMADKFMDNGTLEEARDYSCDGGYPRGRVGWESGVYVRGKCDYSVLWNQKEIVDRESDNRGKREFPATSIEEAKVIAERRGIFVIKERTDKIETDPALWFKTNGTWVENNNCVLFQGSPTTGILRSGGNDD
jgi:hypothetical protein